jgi:hypothetical protein
MKLPSYKSVLKLGKEKMQEALAPIRATQGKMQAQLEIAKLDERIATAEAKIHEICSEHPLNFDKLIEAQDEHALMERRKAQLAKIITELFDSEESEKLVKE